MKTGKFISIKGLFRNYFSKKLILIAISAILCVAASLYFIKGSEGRESYFEEEEGEGIPAILRQMELWSEMRTYPNKEMDASAFNRSYEMARSMMASQSAVMGPMGITPWTNLGPMNISGRILSIAFHPTDPNIMWVGSASGGLWKTTNGGTGAANGINWQYVPTGYPALGIGSIAVNPSNANEIYVGTGEVYSSFPGGSTGAGHVRTFRGSYGIGILKSVDGGSTWAKSLDFTNSSLKGVMDLVINPNTPSTVFAATTDGVYRTTNSGTTWTLVLNVPYAMDMVFKPGDPNVLYVGCGNFQSAGTGIYKTTNANAGTPTFTQLTSANLPNPISGKIMLAISANNPTKIYASIGKDPNTSNTQGLYVSTNEGSTWALAGAANILGNQGWYGHDVAVSPTNANRVIWGELDTYLSTNGGTSNFTKTGSWSSWDPNNTTVGDLTEGASNTTNYVHADVHRIVASPLDPTGNTFFLCTDGGLFRTTNGGSNFNTLNGGLNTSQIYSRMAVHPTNANYMLCGLQDNEALVYEGNPGCRRIGGLGDGFHAAMNSSGTIQMVESYYFNIRRSTNSGSTWGAAAGAVPELACFNVPLVFSRVSGSAYAFGGTIYFKRSTNSGSTWSNLNGGNPIAGANNPIIAMVAPTNDIVYFSTAPASGVRSKLWKTTNATAANPSFTEITNGLPDRYYSNLDVDPTNPNRLFVTLSGFGSSHVYMSIDGGATWSDLNANLPDIPHNSVFINPAATSQVYVGNDLGVFVANNVPVSGPLGPTTSVLWVNYSNGLGDAIMANDMLVTNTGKLRLGTYGRGLWETDMASLTLPVLFKEFTVTPGKLGNQLNWAVATQVNTRNYEVEYGTDGIQFNRVATLPAKMGSGDISYSYFHANRNETDGYYRIKCNDLDGRFTYSVVRMIKAEGKAVPFIAYPNPTNGMFKIRISALASGVGDIQVYATDGSLLKEVKAALVKGQNEVGMDITGFASGNYKVICIVDNKKSVISLIKK